LKNFNFTVAAILYSFLFITYSTLISAQSVSNFEYVNPIPNSSYASVKTCILIRQGSVINKASLNASLIRVVGTKSGTHTGKLSISDDNKTIIFTPDTYFQTDEDVTVTLNKGITTRSGISVSNLEFRFHTSKNISTFSFSPISQNNSPNNLLSKVETTRDSALPSNLPRIVINKSNNPSAGYLFISPSPYLMIVDNEGTPVFYRNVGGTIYDFDFQADGELTYYIYPVDCYGLDSSLNQVRTFNTVGGYTPDVHELRVLPDSSYYILGKRNVYVNMDTVVSGGQPNADIIDGALQEFDKSGNLIFEWDAINHYNLTDVDSNIDLTQPTIDFTHLNAVTIDTDGNPIISARNLDEITKIDHNTGNIIWRWGGKNNQFTFINDNIGFSRQHDIRRFSNGDFSLFDNGVYHADQVSTGIEYKLDEKNKTATLVRRIYVDNLYTSTEGNVEELPNGNRLISWGHNYAPFLTEITPDDSIAYELSYTNYVDTYRAFRYKWETNLFKTNEDSINFGKVADGDSVIKSITIYNPRDTALTINEFYNRDASFSTISKFPLTIQPKDSATIKVMFKPVKRGIFTDKENIRIFGSQQMIARQVNLYASTINLINPINAPSNLKAISIDSSEAELKWIDNSDNESKFVIERKDGDSSSTNNFIAIDTVQANDTLYYDKTVKNSFVYTYRIYAVNKDTLSTFSNLAEVEIVTSVNVNQKIPNQFALYQNYPNPFNPSTVIEYDLPKSSNVTLKVFNLLGQKIKTLVNKFQRAGEYSVEFNGANLSSGIYFYELKTKNYMSIKKLVLLK